MKESVPYRKELKGKKGQFIIIAALLVAIMIISIAVPLIARMKGGVDLFDYLLVLVQISLGITQISVGALIDMHTKRQP